MEGKQFELGRVFMGHFNHHDDIIPTLNQYCLDNKIILAQVWIIGQLSQLSLASYDLDKKEKHKSDYNETLSILSCYGNISLRDGLPYSHMHGVFSSLSAKTLGGHVEEGSHIVSGEFMIQELIGDPLIRELDDHTGLHTWSFHKDITD
ncbi:MAG: DUF296 domain-containing protein [Spirochaetota bacterium]|nr:DUF296 domain-containing protein [Spirochaetota bacterium]